MMYNKIIQFILGGKVMMQKAEMNRTNLIEATSHAKTASNSRNSQRFKRIKTIQPIRKKYSAGVLGIAAERQYFSRLLEL